MVALEHALDRILASDIRSDIAMPPFAKSAMDGFACRMADIDLPLAIVGEIPAGVWPECVIDTGTCARIMTGAPVPAGADLVIMVEDTKINADGTVSCLAPQKNSNICRQGEDVNVGDIVLQSGQHIRPAHIAVLASVGVSSVAVFTRPSITVFSTGSELVAVSATPLRAQIRNSNGPQLCAQVQALGLAVVNRGVVADVMSATVDAIASASQTSDILIISGGVSEGDYDFVPEALKECGYTILFSSVAMKPGRSMVFAKGPRGYVCALPGNPVSTFMVFELMVKPFLYALMGHPWQPSKYNAVLSTLHRRRNDSRQSALPVRQIAPGVVELIDYHGSAHIDAMTAADGILIVPVGIRQIEKGASVVVRCL